MTPVQPAEAKPLPHEHDWRLMAIDYEDGLGVHELICPAARRRSTVDIGNALPDAKEGCAGRAARVR